MPRAPLLASANHATDWAVADFGLTSPAIHLSTCLRHEKVTCSCSPMFILPKLEPAGATTAVWLIISTNSIMQVISGELKPDGPFHLQVTRSIPSALPTRFMVEEVLAEAGVVHEAPGPLQQLVRD